MTEWRRVEPAGDGGGRPVPGGPRHQSRIHALQVLYEVDLTDHAVEETLTHLVEEEPVTPEVARRAGRLVRGVREDLGDIDARIAAAAPAYPVAQLSAIDRNVLRLATYELLHEPDVPTGSAINEAVELAKRFGGDNSGRFVNGALGTILAGIPSRQQAKAAPKRRRRKRPDAPGGEVVAP